jgi:hypothetical protein
MRLQRDGDIEVSPGETITVEIEAMNTAFLAHTGALRLGQWATVDRVSPLKEVRKFSVTSTFSTNFFVGIGFDFSLGPAGTIAASAKYDVRISGTGQGGFVRQRTIVPTSILPTTRVFSFEVGQG